jgi:hypothetical protein
MMRFLKAHNIGIRLPDQVPPMIKNSFDLLIPVLVVVLTLYPLSLLIQSEFGMLIPQAIMSSLNRWFLRQTPACDPAGGVDWPSAVVCGDPRCSYCLRDAADVLADQPGANQTALAPASLCHISLWKRSGRSLS